MAPQLTSSVKAVKLPGQTITGAVVSSMVKVASSIVALLLASVRVKVTVSSVPVAPHVSLKPKLVLVIVTEPQLSAPVKVLFNHSSN